MFDKVDTDKSGAIDYSEFVVATMNEKNLLSNNKLQTAFKMFDKDGGGSISTDEIKQVLSFGQNLDEEVVNQIIKQVDANGDGEISFDEFAQMMLKNIEDWDSTINFHKLSLNQFKIRHRNILTASWYIPTTHIINLGSNSYSYLLIVL